MLIILYIIISVVGLFLVTNIYNFLTNFYKKPFLVNTFAEFIPSDKIINNQYIKNNNGSFSAIIQFQGFSYFSSSDLIQSMEDNFKIKCRALNFNNLDDNLQLKFNFKKYLQDTNKYENLSYLEITAKQLNDLVENATRLLSSLSVYNPKILSNNDLLSYIFFNTNLIKKSFKLDEEIEEMQINDICSFSQVIFEKDYGLLQNIETKKYFKVFSFN